jgi:hypothetical protein
MTHDDDFIQQLEGYLDEYEGTTPLPDAVRNAVRAQLPTTQQFGPVSGLMRDLIMDNNYVRVGLVAVAAVIVVVIAINLLPGSPAPGGEPTPSPSVAPSATPEATPQPTPTAFTMAVPGAQATVAVPPGWTRNGWYLTKSDLFLSAWPVAVENVYGDPCHWQSSLLDPPVGPTVDDLATALGNQLIRDATVEDVTLGGYSGKVVHMSLPADLDWADCDLAQVGAWSEAAEQGPSRTLQSPGELDDVYIVDVEGVRVVVTDAWMPTSAAADVAELEAMLDSITIQP